MAQASKVRDNEAKSRIFLIYGPTDAGVRRHGHVTQAAPVGMRERKFPWFDWLDAGVEKSGELKSLVRDILPN